MSSRQADSSESRNLNSQNSTVAKRIAAIKPKSNTAKQADDDEEFDSNFEPLDRNKTYTPLTLQQAMRCGRRKYERYMEEERLPRSYVAGRVYHSGRLVTEWIEERSTNGKQESKR